jgi:putative drug exporter of the RND superfamily
MSTWTSRMAMACARHPWRALGGWGVALVAAFVSLALLLPSALTTEGRFTADRDSLRGWELIDERLPELTRTGSEVVVVRSETLPVRDPAFERFVARLADELVATGEAAPVPTAWSTADPSLVSASGRATLLPVTLVAEDQLELAVEPLLEVVRRADADPAFDVAITGAATLGHDFVRISERDLQRGEFRVGLPAALLILLLVFGSAVAGLLPLVLALVSIPVTLGISAVVGQVWSLSFFLINMVTAMGLALGIDYALFVVSRYREERRSGRGKIDAISTAAGTAGSAVLFSGLSFVIGLSGLFLVPDTVLRSLATGAVIVGLVTVAAALTLLPALLSLLGDRVDALRVPFVHSAVHAGESAEGRVWRRVIGTVMRRPALFLAGAGGVLLLLAVPVLGLQTGSSGLGALPDDAVTKRGFLALEREFPAAGRTDPARVVVEGATDDPAVVALVEDISARAAAAGFSDTRTGVHPEARLTVVDVPLPGDANDAAAEQALRLLRASVVAPAADAAGVPAYVTGVTAFNVDYAELVAGWLPIVIAFVLTLTFVLLTVVFRSVVLAAKAVLLNLLSVGAAYGLLVLVFQEGYGADLLGFTQVDSVEPWVPVFLFSVLFALSMDYHVFLLSRIRERYHACGDTAEAVAQGISSTARLITGAALIIVVVFAGFALGDLVGFQQMGFGVAVALLIDATVVRSVVVPTSMALLGRWNWYLPSWLAWLPELQVEGATAPVPGQRPGAGRPEDVDGPPAAGGRQEVALPQPRGAAPVDEPRTTR